MSKFTCLLLCVVAVTSNVYAISEESKSAFQEAMKLSIVECSEAHDVSKDDLKAAMEVKSSVGLNPCFLGCVLKKSEIINAQGLYDIDAALSKFGSLIQNKEDLAKIEEIGKKCLSVNDQAVSDGEAGCDRAQLLMTCIHENKGEVAL